MKDLIGNDELKKHFVDMVDKGMVGNSLLFTGLDGVGKSLFARALAKMILKTENLDSHPDFHVLRPEGKIGMHTIDNIRWLSQEVYLPPHTAKRKVFVVQDAHSMLKTGANALLKTFEEPSLDSVIILVTHHPEMLLPTIISRCRTINFSAVSSETIAQWLQEHHNKNNDEAMSIAMMSGGSVGRAVSIASGEMSKRRQLLMQFLPQGGFRSYKDLSRMVDSFVELVEADNKNMEERLHHDLVDCDLTAVQKDAREKEIFGAIASHSLNVSDAIFDDILAWYRDLQLLEVGGDTKYLFYKEELPLLQQTKKKIPLDVVQKAIDGAQLALRRSTKLATCFETFLLKLDMV